MTRTAFLAALEQLLAPLPEAERKDALSYYEDYLDAAGPENEARAIAELGSPEEVARKILDEQSPQGTFAAPASPAPRSRWRMVLGGGLAVLILVCFFFQHSKATPVQPAEPASPAVDSNSVPEETSSTYLAVPADTVPLTIPADDLGESTLQIPLEKLNQELKLSLNYGSVTFVTDPSLTSDKYATFQFDNFPHSPVLRTTGGDGRTALTFEMPENWQVAENAPEAMLTVTIPADALTRLFISLETGDVRPCAHAAENADCCAGQWQSACRRPDRDPRPAGRAACWQMRDRSPFHCGIRQYRCNLLHPSASGWRPRRLHDRRPHG